MKTRSIRLPNRTVVNSLALGQQNRIYVAGYNAIGYLATDSTGELGFRSLTYLIPDSLQEVDTHWVTGALGGEVFFVASSFILKIDQSTHELTQVWTHDRLVRLFIVDEQAYIWRTGIGPGRIEGEHLIDLPTTMEEEEWVFMTRSFQYPGISSPLQTGPIAYDPIAQKAEQIPLQPGTKPIPVPWQPEIASLWEAGSVSDLRPLGKHGHLLTTKNGDLLLLDAQGTFRDLFNQETGLNGIQYSHPRIWLDHAQSLWVVAADEGVARVEPFSPISEFGKEEFGVVGAIIRHQGQIYIGTRKSIFRMVPAEGIQSAARWVKVCDLENVFGFCADGDNLYAAAFNGVYLIDSGAENPAIPVYQALGDYFFIQPSAYDPSLFYLGANGAVKILGKKNGRFYERGVVELGDDAQSLVETSSDTIWIGTSSGGLNRIVLSDSMVATQGQAKEGTLSGTLTTFQEEAGIPSGLVHVCKVRGQLLVATSPGIQTI